MTPAVKVATTHVPKWEKLLEIKVWADACIQNLKGGGQIFVSQQALKSAKTSF